ncbi:MAG: hypothetical protein IKG30_05725 [Clostridiales bacterium]|nr:hypothetical protein [Clostridiales bacterium]
MLHYKNTTVAAKYSDYEFGIEKESLRVTGDGSFAHTPHPFPVDKYIVRDFCENQLEINTGVSKNEEAAITELEYHERRVRETLYNLPKKEYVWHFSNPPYIKDEDDIPVATFTGPLYDKTIYRDYLAKMYGKYKMTFSGIHVNFSFGEELIEADYKASGSALSLRDYKDRLYLDLASNLVSDGWILNVLLSASPVLDGSFLEQGVKGKTDFLGMASVRCSELGYWNLFVPVLDYSDTKAYSDSIRKYINEGLITSQTELYYPVRIKPRGHNSLETLEEIGINHIELRNVDINPYSYGGLDVRDLKFIRILALYEASSPAESLGEDQQIKSAINFKNAAHFDLDTNRIMLSDGRFITLREASLELLSKIEEFYKELNQHFAVPESEDITDVISYQRSKVNGTGKRYAELVLEEYGDDFLGNGLKTVKAAI